LANSHEENRLRQEVIALMAQVKTLRERLDDREGQLVSLVGYHQRLGTQARKVHTLWMDGDLTRQTGMLELEKLLIEGGFERAE
jgi:hypothetical protein